MEVDSAVLMRWALISTVSAVDAFVLSPADDRLSPIKGVQAKLDLVVLSAIDKDRSTSGTTNGC